MHLARDREEEVAGVARRVKHAVRQGTLASPGQAALIVRQRLPYVYVAREVLRCRAIHFDREVLVLVLVPEAAFRIATQRVGVRVDVAVAVPVAAGVSGVLVAVLVLVSTGAVAVGVGVPACST